MSRVDIDRNGLQVLDPDECIRLLGFATLGRIGVTSDALPVVLPVNFRMDGNRILFRTGRGTKLDAATRNAVVAFEVDDFDAVSHTGWSVMVTGVAREVTDLSDAEARWIPRWAPGEDGRVVAISMDLISGRRMPAAVAETHSAVVFFVGDRAYKVKKPIDLGFLDFRNRLAREAVCHREVELNRRLSPDVYLGVADVTGPDGTPCDHLVVMRRMPVERRLSTLVQQGEPVEDHLWHLAHQLAAFHSRADRDPVRADHTATVDALACLWTENTTVLADHVGDDGLDPDVVERVQHLALRYLDGRHDLIEERLAAGRACDGHGDLLADDIFCLDDGPRVLDCLEFDDDLRYGDVLVDVAFLAMDLERLGRPDLGDYFLAAYREHSGDNWPASLAHLHIAYRAQVRAKVAVICSDQGDPAAMDRARHLLALSERHLERGRVRLILVGGLPGTGKSTLATGLGEALDATVLSSDEIRKELAGLPPDTSAAAPFGEGIYGPEATAAAYGVLLCRAMAALRHGETVVLDASWIDSRWRALAQALACRTRADLFELYCVTPAGVAAERIRRRLERGGDPSDATPDIAARMATVADPWSTATVVDTSVDVDRALRTALELMRT